MSTNFFGTVVVIPAEASSGQIRVGIVDDSVPELAEVFAIRLTSVELADGEETTIPPSLGTATQVDITIPASDDPFGSISISQETYTVSEGDTAIISLVRVGGSLGVTTVNYASVGRRATAPSDYTETTGTAVFPPGQIRVNVLIPTVDDAIPELVEHFVFSLLGVSGGSLGNITTATVFIDASDSPFGVVGFEAGLVSAGTSIPNPIQSPAMVSLTVTRAGGTTGSTDITWNVVGPGDNGIPSSDIAASSISGVLSLVDGQR